MYSYLGIVSPGSVAGIIRYIPAFYLIVEFCGRFVSLLGKCVSAGMVGNRFLRRPVSMARKSRMKPPSLSTYLTLRTYGETGVTERRDLPGTEEAGIVR